MNALRERVPPQCRNHQVEGSKRRSSQSGTLTEALLLLGLPPRNIRLAARENGTAQIGTQPNAQTQTSVDTIRDQKLERRSAERYYRLHSLPRKSARC